MSYHYLKIFERTCIEELFKLGYLTIARELKRNKHSFYQAEQAQELAQKRRLSCYRKEMKSEYLIEMTENYLKLNYLPEQISNTILKGMISFKTIYRLIYDGMIVLGDLSVLRQKGKHLKPREKRGRFNIRTSIRQLLKGVKKCKEFGN